jgi:hypothetical protein
MALQVAHELSRRVDYLKMMSTKLRRFFYADSKTDI